MQRFSRGGSCAGVITIHTTVQVQRFCRGSPATDDEMVQQRRWWSCRAGAAQRCIQHKNVQRYNMCMCRCMCRGSDQMQRCRGAD